MRCSWGRRTAAFLGGTSRLRQSRYRQRHAYRRRYFAGRLYGGLARDKLCFWVAGEIKLIREEVAGLHRVSRWHCYRTAALFELRGLGKHAGFCVGDIFCACNFYAFFVQSCRRLMYASAICRAHYEAGLTCEKSTVQLSFDDSYYDSK